MTKHPNLKEIRNLNRRGTDRNPFARDELVGVLRVPAGMAVAASGNEVLFIPDEQPPHLLASPGFRRIFEASPEWASQVTDW